MKRALLGTLHNLRLGGLQGLAGGFFVARCDGFFHAALKSTHAASPHPVALRAPIDLAHHLLCRFRIRHLPTDPHEFRAWP